VVRQVERVGSGGNTQTSAAKADATRVERIRISFIVESWSIVISKLLNVEGVIYSEVEAFILLIYITCA
jgi:hypothetical protein